MAKTIDNCTKEELIEYLDDIVGYFVSFNKRKDDILRNEYFANSGLAFDMGSSVYPEIDNYNCIPAIQFDDIRPVAEKLGVEVLQSPRESDEYNAEYYIVYKDVALFSLD